MGEGADLVRIQWHKYFARFHISWSCTYSQESVGVAAARNEAAAAATPIQMAAARAQNELAVLKGKHDVHYYWHGRRHIQHQPHCLVKSCPNVITPTAEVGDKWWYSVHSVRHFSLR